MTTISQSPKDRPAGLALKIGLWVAQILIFAAFVASGGMKMLLPIDQLASMIVWPGQYPPEFVRFTGAIDAMGGIGVLLPALTRIRPRLTVFAALGCTVLQILAIVFHVSRGEAMATPLNFVLLTLSIFILWGRARRVPITARAN